MHKSYSHIKEYQTELNSLKIQGYTEKQNGEKLGFTLKQMHNFFYRQRVSQRKIAAGISLKQKGRQPTGITIM